MPDKILLWLRGGVANHLVNYPTPLGFNYFDFSSVQVLFAKIGFFLKGIIKWCLRWLCLTCQNIPNVRNAVLLFSLDGNSSSTVFGKVTDLSGFEWAVLLLFIVGIFWFTLKPQYTLIKTGKFWAFWVIALTNLFFTWFSALRIAPLTVIWVFLYAIGVVFYMNWTVVTILTIYSAVCFYIIGSKRIKLSPQATENILCVLQYVTIAILYVYYGFPPASHINLVSNTIGGNGAKVLVMLPLSNLIDLSVLLTGGSGTQTMTVSHTPDVPAAAPVAPPVVINNSGMPMTPGRVLGTGEWVHANGAPIATPAPAAPEVSMSNPVNDSFDETRYRLMNFGTGSSVPTMENASVVSSAAPIIPINNSQELIAEGSPVNTLQNSGFARRLYEQQGGVITNIEGLPSTAELGISASDIFTIGVSTLGYSIIRNSLYTSATYQRANRRALGIDPSAQLGRTWDGSVRTIAGPGVTLRNAMRMLRVNRRAALLIVGVEATALLGTLALGNLSYRGAYRVLGWWEGSSIR